MISTSATDQPRGSGQLSTVLIVDDIAANREILVDLLETQPGLRLVEAADGLAALQAAVESRPDLILLDVMMPGIDGYEVCRRLRADPRHAEVPVIMVTALDDQASRLAGIEAGADDFITKPFNRAELRARVRSITRLNRYRRLHEARSQLQEVEHRLQTMANQSDEVFWIVALNPRRFVYVSPAAERVWGHSIPAIMADIDLAEKAIHPADLPKLRAACETAFERKERRFECEYRMVGPDGQIRWVLSTGSPLWEPDGSPSGMAGISRDTTERKLAEERIREQAEIMDQAPLAIVIVGLDHRVTYCNRSAAELLELPMEELLGRTAEEIMTADTMEIFKHARAESITKGQWTGEILLTTKAGRRIHTEYHIFVIPDSVGHPRVRLNVIIDITEKKKLEEQFLRAQRLESLGMLAAGIAHDLNNVLAPVLMGAPLLKLRTDRPADIRVLDTIEHSASRGAALVRQILSFAHGARGNKMIVQPKHLLRDIAGLIEQTFPKNIVLESEIASDLWTLEGNPTQLHQVLLNLCVNARDAMPNGGMLRIRAENRQVSPEQATALPDSPAPGPYLMLEVGDTGTGIPLEILKRIWEPFFTTKGDGKGTGLGLSTVRGIAANHGGFALVESVVGRGTMFQIFLPARDAVVAPGPDGAALKHLPSGSGELLLFVDDEASIRDMGSAILTRHGYRVLVAENGLAALEQCAKHSGEIALVITDLNMPGMGGLELRERIRRLYPAMRLTFISGADSQRDGNERVFPTGTKHLAKPFGAEELLVYVGQALGASADRSNPPSTGSD
jgi:two-component system cell cycle sensor histidine kinase/response regulator CckA